MGTSWDIQNPSPGMFSANDISWTPGNIAYIPASRLLDFQDGEGQGNSEAETSFFIRTSKLNVNGPYEWTEYKIFWCSFGPQNIPDCEPGIPPAKGTHPKVGPGSRPRAQKATFNNHVKRGCQCHFIVKKYKCNPEVVEISYKHRTHCNKSGKQVHGKRDRETSQNGTPTPLPWGPKCTVAPRPSNELIGYIEDLLRSGRSVLDIFDLHVKTQFEVGGPQENNVNFKTGTIFRRDDLVSRQDIYNLKREIDRELYAWDGNDQSSVGKWISQNPDKVLIHRQYRVGPPEQKFVLALQSKWQLARMIDFSQGSVLGCDSTFATNKYGFPFFTLVAFDKHQMGLPVAWCIQQTEEAEEISEFLQSVKDRAIEMKPDWAPSCFMIDCAKAEVFAINTVFPNIPIYFCSWHVRRAWKENLIKKVPDRRKLVEMNDDLGDIMYAQSQEEMNLLWQIFQTKYHTEQDFIKYFSSEWMNKTAKWMRAMREMKRANQNTNGATEAFNSTLKKFIRRKIGHIGALRLDRLVYCLFETVVPFFWYQIVSKQTGRVINYKAEEIVINSLQKATYEVKDVQITFRDVEKPNQAVFHSLKTTGKKHTIYNIYSKLPSCSCKWADEGNMCKHQLKALLLKGHAGGILVQQIGTRFGTEWGGIDHLDAIVLDSQQPLIVLDSQQPMLEDEVAMVPEDQTTSQPAQAKKVSDATRLKLAVDELLSIAKAEDGLTEHALLNTVRTINKLKQMQTTLSLTGKATMSTNDHLVRPRGLTSTRRLGVVDKFHGGRRSKRVKVRNKRTPKEKPPNTQEGDTLEEISARLDPFPPEEISARLDPFPPEEISARPDSFPPEEISARPDSFPPEEISTRPDSFPPKEISVGPDSFPPEEISARPHPFPPEETSARPDPFPNLREKRKESFRVELGRLGVQYTQGKKRKSKNAPPVHVPMRHKNLGSLEREGDIASSGMDLNIRLPGTDIPQEDPNNVFVIQSHHE